MRIGFIGLGDQGGAMAQMILAGGFELVAWARRDEVQSQFSAYGADIALSPADVAGRCNVLCLCVTSDADVRDLLLNHGALQAMTRGSILAIHSTIQPNTCRELHRLAADREVTLLDLPVSGSGHAARAGKLLVVAGGDASAISRLMPMLRTYASTVIRMGEVGSGMEAKLLNNLLAVVNIGQAYLVLRLGQSMGLRPTALRRALMAGTGRTFALELIERLEAPGRAAHVYRILTKDTELALRGIPESQRQNWAPLAHAGLAALHKLMSESPLLAADGEQQHDEHAAFGIC